MSRRILFGFEPMDWVLLVAGVALFGVFAALFAF
jgi:hypothetical protein